MQLKSNFNKRPFVPVKGMEDACRTGWERIGQKLKEHLESQDSQKSKVIVVETYQGVLYNDLLSAIEKVLQPGLVIDTASLFLEENRVRQITQPDVTDDRVFGYMTRLKMSDLMDDEKISEARLVAKRSGAALTVIFGYGASLVWELPDLLVYADMARWEIQLRMRAGTVNNLGIQNKGEGIEKQYKRGYFVDWRICDRLKKKTMHNWDYVLDTNDPAVPKLASGEAIREGLSQAARQPISVVPFFDPGPWGGQWMKEKFALQHDVENFAWCFNCVPEENSLLLGFGKTRFEIPSINLVFYRPVALLGDPVHARFGDEFPIRFDFLDTMAGGNLSLQVHPLTEYIQDTFGVNYTQDESYYMLEADTDGSVYLGLREGIDPDKMSRELRTSESDGTPFNAEAYVEKWPAKKHDHFLIPGGTIHCSGKNGMVLEISATPYIFTFKLYDWGRTNLDGKPRPINVDHGLKNIQWDRTASWTKKNLVNRVEKIAEGDGWVEERTGLHEREFIETRRHWFTKKVTHHTNNGVNVLTLVEGDEIIVESPDSAFDPFVVHYAETFIVPAAVETYTIRPSETAGTAASRSAETSETAGTSGVADGKKYGTIKAFVRTNP